MLASPAFSVLRGVITFALEVAPPPSGLQALPGRRRDPIFSLSVAFNTACALGPGPASPSQGRVPSCVDVLRVGHAPGFTLPLLRRSRRSQRREPSPLHPSRRHRLARDAQASRWAAPGTGWSLLASRGPSDVAPSASSWLEGARAARRELGAHLVPEASSLSACCTLTPCFLWPSGRRGEP
jgi:hypothetical protein